MCYNRWDANLCALSSANDLKGRCKNCANKKYVPLDDEKIGAHIRGDGRQVGGYPLTPAMTTQGGTVIENATCFVAADMDNHEPDGSQKNPFADALAVWRVANEHGVPVQIEMSKSKTGAHLWIFFTAPVPAAKARQMMFALLSAAKVLPANTELSSFDRIFPNQDELSGVGLGNLIALPLAGRFVVDGGTCFVDPATWSYYSDQWAFVAKIADQIRAGGGDLVMTGAELDSALVKLAAFLPKPATKKKSSPKKPKSPAPKGRSDKSCVPVIERCAFIQHCRDNAVNLCEDDWKNLISNLCRFDDGPAMIHKFSTPYPGYDPTETDAKIDHLRASSGPITCDHIQQSFFGCPAGGCGVKAPAAPAIAKPKIRPSRITGRFLIQSDNLRVDYFAVAEAFLCHKGYRTASELILRHHRADWLTFDGKVWVAHADADLRHDVTDFGAANPQLANRLSRTFTENVLHILASRCHLDPKVETHTWLGDEPLTGRDLVVMENGILDIPKAIAGDKEALRPHSPLLFTTIALPFAFDPTAACPRFLAFLDEVLPDADSRLLLQEWFGYNLVADTSYHTFLMMVGRGANGKSVVCSILIALLGSANVSTVPLEKMAGRFDIFQTYGKLANVVGEIGEMDKTAEGFLKSFVGGDPITYERKYHDTFSAPPTARLTFATNTPPRFSDRTDGIWRRLLLLPFDVVIPPESRDIGLTEKLLEEMPGIFNWALDGLRRLRGQGRFTQSAKAAAAKDEYRRDVNSARAFLQDEVVADPTGEVETLTLFQSYCDYCKTRNYHPFGENLFGKEVKSVFPKVQKQQRHRHPGGPRVRVYVGIRPSL